jgi:hypothetical protein
MGLALLSSSCSTAKQETRLAAVETRQQAQGEQIEELNDRVSTLISELENTRRHDAREKYCKDPRITDFLDAVEGGLSDSCTPVAMTTSLNFADKVPTAIAYFEPTTGFKSLRQTRIGQIRDNLEPDKLHESTRVLVLAKPEEDTKSGRALALELANQVIENIVKQALPAPSQSGPKESMLKARKPPILGPYLLPCELAHNMNELYKRDKKGLFRPIKGEPKIGSPSVMIFVFVSPC